MLLLQAQIAGRRKQLPSDVLNSYETIKQSDPKVFLDPQLFPLMVLLAVITVWARQRQRYADFRDHTGCMTFRIRRVKWTGPRRHARHAPVQTRRSI